MKILVTGREGQLVRSLIERSSLHPDLIMIPLGRPDLDLERPDNLAEAVTRLTPDLIINAAAYTEVDKAEDEPERAALVNAAAPALLAETARRIGAPIIHISTDYVFDGGSQSAYAEEAVPDPMGVYGRTKLAGEEEVRRVHPDHVIVRTAWIYGPFGRNFLKTMMALARDRDTLNVVDDQRGNPSSSLDLADGLLTIVRSWQGGARIGLGETYHLAGYGAATWFEFASFIMRHCSKLGFPSANVHPISSAEWPTRAPRPANSMLDCSKFFADFGFRMPKWQDSAAAAIERLARQQAQA